MPSIARTLSLALLVLAPCGVACASWAAVPTEVLVDQAHLIVEGRVGKIEAAGFAVGNRPYDVAVVDVSAILKALPHAGKPKQVRIAQPAAAAGGGLVIAVSTDIRFAAGQAGIWLLTKDAERDVYWATHPSQFQNAAEKKALMELIAAREKLPAGEAAGGLEARAELVRTESQARPGQKGPLVYYEIRVSLKNVSDRPITVCDYAGSRPLQLSWLAPDGTEQKSAHYDWLAAAFLPALSPQHFITIPAGGVHFTGPRGGQGFFFQPAAQGRSQGVASLVPGEHRLTPGFASQEDGRQFGLKDVWTGQLSANEARLTTK